MRLARAAGHTPARDRAVARFAHVGDHGAVWMAFAVVGGLVDGARRRRWLRAGGVVAVAYAVNQAIKIVVRRPRPDLPGAGQLAKVPTQLSFPSRARGDIAVRRAGAARRRCAGARRCTRWPGRWRCRGSTSASTTRPTWSPGRCWATSSGGGRPMKVGIVGMPNAGKSSLFNALTRAGAEAANYPFTTIEPNVAVVPVADERLAAVAETIGASKLVHDTIDFHDIAGLVAGAHEGEGLGNKFLANIRETDAIVHVVRAHTRSTTSSTPRAASTRCATSRRSRPS